MRLTLFITLSFLIIMNCAGRIKITEDMTPVEQYQACKKLIEKNKNFQAIENLNQLRYKLLGTEYIDSVIFYLSKAYLQNKDYPEALINYQTVIRDYPNSDLSYISQYMIGICYSRMSLKAELDQEFTHKAIDAFQDFLETGFDSPYIDSAEVKILELQNVLAEKSFKNGLLYFKLNRYEAAEIYFRDILLNYYHSDWTDDSYYYMALTYINMEKYDDARIQLNRILNDFSESKYKKKALKKISEISELK